MARFVVIYATMHGMTERIVRAVEPVLKQAGHQVAMHRIEALPAGFTLDAFDHAVIAAPIYFGKYPKPLTDFVGRVATALNAMPSSFISVCGSAGRDASAKALAGARAYADKLEADSGWHPRQVEIVAGEVAFTRYGFVHRFLLRMINRSVGRSTDTSRDHVYTDWDALARFAERLAATPS
jgi:menaquinone-dependent protoporphyrinogen oxidase